MELSQKFITNIATKTREIAGVDINAINLNMTQLVKGLDFKVKENPLLNGYRLIHDDKNTIIEIPTNLEDADKSLVAILIGQHYIQKIIETENGVPQSIANPSPEVMELCIEFAQNLTMPKSNFIAIAEEYYTEYNNSYNLDAISDALGVDMIDVYDHGLDLGIFSYEDI